MSSVFGKAEVFPSPRGVELHKPGNHDFVLSSDEEGFPSPRGVELHKPWSLGMRLLLALSCVFPSPRGVELHKPRYGTRWNESVGRGFPSPRGVELHKPLTFGVRYNW